MTPPFRATRSSPTRRMIGSPTPAGTHRRPQRSPKPPELPLIDTINPKN